VKVIHRIKIERVLTPQVIEIPHRASVSKIAAKSDGSINLWYEFDPDNERSKLKELRVVQIFYTGEHCIPDSSLYMGMVDIDDVILHLYTVFDKV